VFDVEEPKLVESADVNTALSECVPAGKVVIVDAIPPQTGTAAPMLVLSCINCTEPAAGGLTVASRVSTVTAAIAEWAAGVTSSAVIVAAGGASKAELPTGGAALATPPSSDADPAAKAIRTLNNSRAKDLPLRTMYVTLAQEWRRDSCPCR